MILTRAPNTILVAALALGLGACAQDYGITATPTPDTIASSSENNGTPGDGTGGGGSEPFCHDVNFTQPAPNTGYAPLDVLFVTDTSSSLDEGNGGERGKIADGITSFLGQLPAGLDARIAVMLAHGVGSNNFGKLWAGGTDLVLQGNDPLIQSKMRTKLTNLPQQTAADGGEAMFHSLAESLDNATKFNAIRNHSNPNYQFYRTGASLAVIFISDEQDICDTRGPVDGEGTEISYRNLYCDANTQDSVYTNKYTASAMKTKLDGKFSHYLVAGIVYKNEATLPHTGENSLGYGMLDLISLTSGISTDLAASNLAPGLADIGTFTANSISNLIDDVTLAHLANLATIEVKIDNVLRPSSDWSYDSNTRNLHLNFAGQSLSVVDIHYCEPPAS